MRSNISTIFNYIDCSTKHNKKTCIHCVFLFSYIMDINILKGDETMIGILAGMGPKSTGPFVDTVVAGCQTIYGAKHDMDFPHMMIYSCPTPFYIDRPIDHEAMKKRLLTGHKNSKVLAQALSLCRAIRHIFILKNYSVLFLSQF